MNLQEVLNYRKKCLICNRNMKVVSRSLALDIVMTKQGIYTCSSPKESKISQEYSVHFKFDGTYEKGKKWWDTYSKPLTLVKECSHCVSKNEFTANRLHLNGKPSNMMVLKPRSAGMSTMSMAVSTFGEIQENHCAFSFKLFGDSENNFDCNLEYEDLQFRTKTTFYHMKTDFDKGITYIKSGDFNKTIDSILQLEVPAVNTSSILTKDKLAEKIGLYNLFS